MRRRPTALVVEDNNMLYVYCPYKVNEAVKLIPGCRWNPGRKAWCIPRQLRRELEAVLRFSGCTPRRGGVGPEKAEPTQVAS